MISCLLFVPLAPWNVFGPLAIVGGTWAYAAVDAFAMARGMSGAFAARRYDRWYTYAAIAVAMVFVVYPAERDVLRKSLGRSFRITSDTMEPSLLESDYIFVKRLARPVERGDIIVFAWPQHPNSLFMSRVVGLPGDTLEMRNKALFINGRETREVRATRRG
jgi:signal peptidase I